MTSINSIIINNDLGTHTVSGWVRSVRKKKMFSF